MKPTTLSFALSMAFNPDWHDLTTVAEYRQCQKNFSTDLRDGVAYLNQLLRQYPVPAKNPQRLFDALVSVIYDIGLDNFDHSTIPDAIMHYTPSNIKSALRNTPTFNDTVSPVIAPHCQKLRVPTSDRRLFEISLLHLPPFFLSGRTHRPPSSTPTNQPTTPPTIVYAPYPLHPIQRWFFKH